jgi:tetratricopeptide (TPR) repeat protein
MEVRMFSRLQFTVALALLFGYGLVSAHALSSGTPSEGRWHPQHIGTLPNMAVAQISKEWSQCSGREGAIADLIIDGCSAVIQAGQDSPNRLATAFNNRGVAHKFKGEYDLALEDYNQAILLNPSFANAYNNRGVIYRLKSDYDRAIKDYDEAIWLDSNIPAFFYNRAIAYSDKEDYGRAIGDFDAVLRFNPKNALGLYGRGVARMKNGDAQNGSADIAAANALNPNVVQEYEHSGKR